MLVTEVRERVGDQFQITVDFDYSEISGPEPDRVTHVLRVPWLGTVDKEAVSVQLSDAVNVLCSELGLTRVTVATG